MWAGLVKGCVSYGADALQGLLPSPAFVAGLKAHGVEFVRFPVSAGARNVFDSALQAKAVKAYVDQGVRVGIVLHVDFNRPWLEGKASRVMYPNEALGYDGNPRQNRYIKDTGVRIENMLPPLVEAGAEALWLSNEDNLLPLHIGDNVPIRTDSKAPAEAPEVTFSRWYELRGYAHVAGFKHIFSGSFSVLPGTGLNPSNPYFEQYIDTGVKYLQHTGVKVLPLDALSMNTEGWWTAQHAAEAANVIRKAFAPLAPKDAQGWPVPYPLVLGEWGTFNRDLPGHETQAIATALAWAPLVRLMCFYQYPCMDPHDLSTFALTDWVVQNGMYYPSGLAGQAPWSPMLTNIYTKQL